MFPKMRDKAFKIAQGEKWLGGRMNIYLDKEIGPRKRRKKRKRIFMWPVHPAESGSVCSHGCHSI